VARRALDLAIAARERGNEAEALRVIAEVARADQHPDFGSSQDYYERSLALASALGMRPLVAHCHLGLGRLSRLTDKLEQAREPLTTASTMYREMGMRFWLEQAQREIENIA
jgi:hypothetical protein